MGMAKTASAALAQAREWIGRNEADGTHKGIIDVYNGHTPLARGYRVKYTDAWCATFVSAVAIKCGLTEIIPTECGCGQMIELFRAKGEWQETLPLQRRPWSLLRFRRHPLRFPLYTLERHTPLCSGTRPSRTR